MVESFDGCRLNVAVSGPADAPALLLSHHLGGRLETFDALAAALSSRRRVIRWDTRGQGASDAPAGDYSVEMLGRDALAVLDALAVSRADMVGVSQGGMTAMWLGVHAPGRVRRLVLANTTPFIPNKAVWDEQAARAGREGMTGIAAATIAGWLSEGFRARAPEAVARLVADLAALTPAGFAGNAAVLRDVDLRAELGRIAAPVLVIGGAEDGPRGASAPVIATGVQNGRLVFIPNAAHLAYAENPDAFLGAVEAFLDGPQPASAGAPA